MKYFFEDQNDVEQFFETFDECMSAARNDPTVLKFRDTQGGEYHV